MFNFGPAIALGIYLGRIFGYIARVLIIVTFILLAYLFWFGVGGAKGVVEAVSVYSARKSGNVLADVLGCIGSCVRGFFACGVNAMREHPLSSVIRPFVN